jgi:CheY-like chemotaxis protein
MSVSMSEPNILVVEDDPDAAHLICRELRKHAPECGIVCSSDGLQAKERLESGYFPLFILTDIQMPRMDGLQLITWIRSQPHLQNVPVAVLSASENPAHIERCNELKVQAFFKKGEPLAKIGLLMRRLSAPALLESMSAS